MTCPVSPTPLCLEVAPGFCAADGRLGRQLEVGVAEVTEAKCSPQSNAVCWDLGLSSGDSKQMSRGRHTWQTLGIFTRIRAVSRGGEEGGREHEALSLRGPPTRVSGSCSPSWSHRSNLRNPSRFTARTAPHTHICTRTRTRMRAHTYTRTHPHARTRTRTHTHTQPCWGLPRHSQRRSCFHGNRVSLGGVGTPPSCVRITAQRRCPSSVVAMDTHAHSAEPHRAPPPRRAPSRGRAGPGGKRGATQAPGGACSLPSPRLPRAGSAGAAEGSQGE